LDVFGDSSLFQRLNRTVTQEGSKCLARRLTQLPEDQETIERHRSAINELKEMPDWRIKWAAHEKITGNIQTLYQVLQPKKDGHRFISSPILTNLTPLIALGVFVLCLFDILPWALFGTCFLLQLLTAIIISKRTTKINQVTDQLNKEFRAYTNLLKEIDTVTFQSAEVSTLKHSLSDSLPAFKKLTKLLSLFNLRNNDIMYVVTNGLLLLDLQLIRRFSAWQQAYMPHLERWINDIGEMDALISLAGYAFNHPQNCQAELLDAASPYIIEATGMYHPFLASDKAVANDYTLKKHGFSIVTGANMAGKSTFLRTVGVNYILAANGAPVCATSFRFALTALFSSMRTTDDLSNNISYFNAELLRLKQLILFCRSHRHTLIILDEILKGTNSKDKLKGSMTFLQEMLNYPVSGIIATHDLELARLQEENASIYTDYCFEIELSEDITYTYKMQKGVAKNLNATYLLNNMLKDIRKE
jgi:DNA mismatch repair ATPase MutS